VEYAILLALIAVVTIGGLALMGGGVGDVYRRVTEAVGVATPDSATATPEPAQLRDITVNVLDARDVGIPNVDVFAFDAQSGAYLAALGQTTQNGTVVMRQARPGSYTFRADYQGQQYFSSAITAPGTTTAFIRTGRRSLAVRVIDNKDRPLKDVPVYAFTFAESYYSGMSATTDRDGNATLQLADGDFKIRADYEGDSYWSEMVSMPETAQVTIKIDGCSKFTLGEVQLLGAGGGLDGGRVAVKVNAPTYKLTITSVEVDWSYLDRLPDERRGRMRVFGIYVCGGAGSTNCSARGRFLNNVDFRTGASDMNDDSSPSSAGANPQETSSAGGWVIVDFDSLYENDDRSLSDAPWYLRPGDFGFTVHTEECPAVTKPATPR